MEEKEIVAKFGDRYIADARTFKMGIDRRITARIAERFRGRGVLETCTDGESARTRETGTCCGDIFHGVLPTGQVIEQMKAKGKEMPPLDILVYCVSCSKAMFVAGRKPRYLVDLLFAEETVPGTVHPDEWHKELDAFMEAHAGGK